MTINWPSSTVFWFFYPSSQSSSKADAITPFNEHDSSLEFPTIKSQMTSTISGNIKNNTIRLDKLKRNKKILSSLSSLSENWNGYGSQSFNPYLVNKVEHTIVNMDMQPNLYPTGRNSIQLEFEKHNGDYLEFEVFEEETHLYSIINGVETEKKIRGEQINQITNKFHAE